MSHHNIGDSNSSSSSSEHSENEDDYDLEEDDDDDEGDNVELFHLEKNPSYPSDYPIPKRSCSLLHKPILDNTDPNKHIFHWASLHSHSSSYDGIDMCGEKLFIGKGGVGHVTLEDVFVEVCLVYIRPGEASLEITSTSGFVYVNQKPVRKCERIILQNNDEIGFYFKKTYVFTIVF
ncbi:hypothetical protein QTN25_010799 [Entamoeba marina]